ncbi:autotransporter outer membrane beta-barrel domain-containing protein [Budvicia aquatica]|uniref:autotransporter outer membrane beta-barrel domain-containing protein n=1 Tax=Budvicia aquatica TaxID=82979 RepID=UPI002084BE7E|nr:autotransporter outer membrane beta-barrel domain-containing protein [Budvicia aquatica]GKX52934.1 hypothetical protein SOASR029_32430 [Budvicia aquatica]
MNKIFRTIWNQSLGVWVAVSEITHSPMSCRSSRHNSLMSDATFVHRRLVLPPYYKLRILSAVLGFSFACPGYADIATQQRANSGNILLDQDVNISLTTSGTSGYTLWAQNAWQITATTHQFMLASAASSVIYADSGGQITLDGTGGVLDISSQTTSSGTPIISATGAGSTIDLTNATIHGVTGAASNLNYGVLATAGARLNLTDSQISLVGGTTDSQSGPTAIYVSGAGTVANLNDVTLNLTTVSTRGGGLTGLSVNDKAVVVANDLAININSGTAGPQVGVRSTGTGSNLTLNNMIFIGTAATTANQIITGIQALSGGALTLNGGSISGNGIVTGLSSNGLNAVMNANNFNVSTSKNSGNQLVGAVNGATLNFTGGTISTSGITGMVTAYASASNSRLNLKDASIIMQRGGATSGSNGMALYTYGPSLIATDNTLVNVGALAYSLRVLGGYTSPRVSGGQIQLVNGSQINVVGGYSTNYGASYGILVDGTDNGFTGTDSSITTSRFNPTLGAGVAGITVQNNGTANLTGMQVSTTGDASLGVVGIGSATQIALNGGNTITTNGTNAHALVLQNGAVLNGSTANGTIILAQGVGAKALYFSGVGMTNTATLNGVALSSAQASAINVVTGTTNLTLTSGSVSSATGAWLDVAAGANAQVSLDNAEQASGTILTGSGATNNLSISNGSAWNITDNSHLSNLTLNNGRLFFATDGAVTVDSLVTLTGGGGEFDTNGLSVNFDNQLRGDGQLIKIGAGSLILTNADSQVASVDVQSGTLNFSQNGTFYTTGDYTTRSGATTQLGFVPVQINVGGAFTQETGSTLNVTVGALPDIVADHAVLGGELVVNGFQTGEFPIKASDVQTNAYTMIHTTGTLGITGNFTNPVGSDLGLDYLIERGYISADQKDYNLGFQMAWMDGGKTQGTGNFTLNDINDSFDVDLVLSNQTIPTAGFDSGWTGDTLTKMGTGSLMLSTHNTYTGTTDVAGGSLDLSGAGDISASSQLILSGSNSVLNTSYLTGNTTTINNLSGVDGAKVILSGSNSANLAAKTLVINNQSNADSNGNTEFSGVIEDAGLASNVTKTGAGSLVLSGNNTYTGTTAVDEGTLSVGTGGTSGSLSSSLLTIADNSMLIFNRSDDSEFTGLITADADSFLLKQGSGILTLSMADSQLGNSTIEAGTLQLAQNGIITNTGDFTVQSSAGLSLGHPNSHLNIGGDFVMQDNSMLSVFVDPRAGVQYADINALSAQIGANVKLNIAGFSAVYGLPNSSDYQLNDLTVIHATNGLSFVNGATDFASLMVGGASQPVDYLVVEGKQVGSGDYDVGVGLSWYGAHFNLPVGQMPTGNFTLTDATESFQVDAELNNEASYGQPGDANYWDGQSLTKKGTGTLILSSANTYTGDTRVEQGALVLSGDGDISYSRQLDLSGADASLDILNVNGESRTINDLSGVAGSQIYLGDKNLTVNNNTDTQFAGDISESTGSLNKTGSGELTLSGITGWTGETTLQAGTLTLDGSTGGGQLVSNITGASGSSLSLISGATLTGAIDPANVNIDTDSVWNMTGNSQANTFTIGGTVNFSNPGVQLATGRTLSVQNWVGNGGLVDMYTALGKDNSVTDKLLIAGDSSGTTRVNVNNAGGNGASTLNGIELIQVNGASDGEFVQNGRIVAGAYDYTLGRGAGSQANNWYLTSKADPNPNPSADVQRPESGSYTANLATANTLFVTSLHDRLGETQYIDALTGEKKVTSMWLRGIGGHNRWRDGSGQLKTQSDRYVIQVGGDIAQWSTSSLDRWHLGLMAGYGNSQSDTDSRLSGYGSKGSVDGYSLGAYATWYANQQDKSGWYVDTWAQYSWFNNTVKGQDIQEEKYHSDGVTASVESGYTLKLGEKINSEQNLESYFIQPKVQAVWMGVKADNHNESNGTRVSGGGDGNIMTRVSLRAYMQGHKALDDGKDRIFQPFVEASWIHNTDDFGATMNGVTVTQAGARNVGELKLGVEGQWNPELNLWGNVGQQLGDKGYSNTALTVGFKYTF